MEGAVPGGFAAVVDGLQALTARMLDAAAADDWETVAQLDDERASRLQTLEAGRASLQEPDLDAAVERLRALVATDGRLSILAAEARRQALAGLRRARGGVRGRDKYHELARDRWVR